MVGAWQWSVRLWWLSAHFWQVNALSAPNYTYDHTPFNNPNTSTSDLLSTKTTTLNSGASVESPFDIHSSLSLSEISPEHWLNTTFSGRSLRQIDQVFQQSYWLVGCRAGVPNEAAARLKRLVTQIRLNLKIVLREVEKGVDSEFGYKAFFKTNDNIPRVLEIFKNIANGDKLKRLRPNQRSSWLVFGKGNPIIGCALSMEDRFNSEAHAGCKSPLRYAYQPLGSAWMFICPNFWRASERPSALSCPRIHNNGSFAMPDDMELHMNQQTIFVHEMVHIYLGLPFQSEVIETYTLGDVTELDGDDAVINASNYGYFYAAVLAACMRWPHRAPIDGEEDRNP